MKENNITSIGKNIFVISLNIVLLYEASLNDAGGFLLALVSCASDEKPLTQ